MAPDSEDDEQLEPASARPNKEQLKRQTREIKELVVRMIDMPAARLEGVTLAGATRAAIVTAGKMERTALKRQIKYIVGLMRNEDVTLVGQQLRQLSRPHQQAVRAFHQVEQWRDELIAGNDDLIDTLVERFSHADRQQLRQLVRQARKQPALSGGKSGRAARSLFRYLSAMQQG